VLFPLGDGLRRAIGEAGVLGEAGAHLEGELGVAPDQPGQCLGHRRRNGRQVHRLAAAPVG